MNNNWANSTLHQLEEEHDNKQVVELTKLRLLS